VLDFNARRYCLLMGAVGEASAERPVRKPAASNKPDSVRFVHLREIAERSALSAKELMRLVRDGMLDPPRRIHYRALAWRSDYIESWLESRNLLLPLRTR
jgi:predicted DNA-binding transcriptional regulator AlpA